MTTQFILGMRDAFFDALYEIFKKDKSAVLISADNGAPSLDKFWTDLPDQSFTVGIAEQQLIGMACGMAFEGRKVYTYAIAPFVTLRCYEQVKLDMCAMNLPIVNIGIGAGYAYDIMGPTHHTTEDISIMRALPNLVIHSPADATAAAALARIAHETASPQYIRFDRTGIPDVYAGRNVRFEDGVIVTKEGRDLYIVATGVMVHEALKAAKNLEALGINAGVLDLCRLKPINEELLLSHLQDVGRAVTLEEHRLPGGMGSAIAEIFVDGGLHTPLLRIGQGDRFIYDLGGRETIWELYGLDAASVTDKIARWMGNK